MSVHKRISRVPFKRCFRHLRTRVRNQQKKNTYTQPSTKGNKRHRLLSCVCVDKASAIKLTLSVNREARIFSPERNPGFIQFLPVSAGRLVSTFSFTFQRPFGLSLSRPSGFRDNPGIPGAIRRACLASPGVSGFIFVTINVALRKSANAGNQR